MSLTRAARLGDDIDDFCVKCKRVMNHSVVSILNNAPAKVRCRTCHSDHDFRNEQPPPPKVDPRKAALFNLVLGNVTGLPPASPETTAVSVPEAEAPDADATEGNTSATGKPSVKRAAAKTAAATAEGKSKARKKA